MEKDWRKLEKLLFKYIDSLLRNEKILFKEITASSHDDGYDATWLVLNSEFNVKNILMESKYRTTESSLPLTDCAKAIIISFNIGADKLYVGTNIVFSPQALNEAEKFKKRSNLDIEFIDGLDLRKFISNNKSALKKYIGNDFLQKIIDSTINLKRSAITQNSPQIEKYNFDVQRQQVIDLVTNSFLFSACTNIITGIEGIGKSFVCNSILNQLKKREYVSSVIDLSLCTSTRTLYIGVLEAIWGVGIKEIIEEKNIKDYIDTLISTSKAFSNMNIPKAVKQILLSSTEDFYEYQDIFLHLLLLYIDEILFFHKNNINLVIMFENINMVSKDVIVFLISIVRILNKNNIRCLLEIRTPLLLFGASPDESNYLFNEMIKISNLKPYNINEFSDNECIKLIRKDLALNDRVCYSLIRVLCSNPLEIQCAIELLKKKSFKEIEYINTLQEKELMDYWEKQQISINNVAISLINNLRVSERFGKLFELTILFNGEIDDIELLNDIFNSSDIIDIAEKSSLYEFSYGVLSCKHLRYIQAMKRTSNNLINYDVAYKVMSYANRTNKKYDLLIELEILYSIHDFKKIPYKIIEISKSLIITHQYDDIINIIKRYIDNFNLKFTNNSLLEIHIILYLKLLHCISETHTGNNKKNLSYYVDAERLIKTFNSNLYNNKYWIEYQLLLWDRNFTIGNYSNSFEIAENLYLHLDEICLLFDESYDCAGRIYTAYGLSNKSVEGGIKANDIFVEGTEKFPNSFYCKASLLSHEGNYYLKHNPILALDKYYSLLENVEDKQYPYREILHTRVDISMTHFLCENYKKSKNAALECINISEPIGMLSQKGRALNILACCYSVEKDNKKAKQYLEESIVSLFYSNANIYYWRAQLNYASILIYENSESKQAYDILYEVYDFLKSTNYNKIINDENAVSHQGILLILAYLYCGNKTKKIKQILSDFKDTIILSEYQNIIQNNNWQNYFTGKIKYINGIVYVMG